MFIALTAFWLEETWVLRVIFADLVVFLSGSLLPLEFYPDWLAKLLYLSPFPYMTWYPAKLCMGDRLPLGPALQSLALWNLIAFLLTVWIWKKGLKLYSAAGM